jgi:acyl transferase domain-containing protein
MAGRFPGAPDLDHFWRALAGGECLVSEVPPDRWVAATFYDPDPSAVGRTVSKWAGFLDGIDRFDAGFFNISPREAAAMDPQHRLFLEQAWLAFENAGYAADRLKGSATGVFVGASNSGYDALLEPDAKAAQSYGLTGNLVSLLASRISYFLDLRGPALVVDTACSASLVALDLACQALRRGEIGMALVGGVSLFLDEKPFVAMTRTGMLSPDGRCHTFDATANGIVVGEAVAAVVLKPLAQALADGDRIDAVIKATGTNQDGRSNGITAPNPDAQTALPCASI